MLFLVAETLYRSVPPRTSMKKDKKIGISEGKNEPQFSDGCRGFVTRPRRSIPGAWK
jgi:hypothetical protein